MSRFDPMIFFRQSKQRGSLIVSALLLFSILLALGLGIMSSQSVRMRAVQAQVASTQAKQLALAGWADIAVKLGKDRFFTNLVEDQTFISYSEDVYLPDTANPTPVTDERFYGTYTVVCDCSRVVFEPSPVGIFVVTVTGKVGPRNETPLAERRMEFELDAADHKVIRISDDNSF